MHPSSFPQIVSSEELCRRTNIKLATNKPAKYYTIEFGFPFPLLLSSLFLTLLSKRSQYAFGESMLKYEDSKCKA
jgi:hypothetical protein